MSSSRALSLALAPSLAVAVAFTAGCTADSDSAESRPGTVSVVTGLYPLEYLTRQVGGDRVSVTNLTKPGAEPHDLELAPRQVGQVSEAGLVVLVAGMQPALDQAVAQNPPKTALDVATVVPLSSHGIDDDHTRPAPAAGHGQADHAHPTHSGHADEHADEHADHGHGGRDPHVWLDPTRYAKVATAVGEQLATSDPAHAAEYRARASDLTRRLTALDAEFSAGLRTCQRRDILTNHAAFGYLVERYRLNQVAINGLSPESEPSAQRIAQIQQVAREKGATTVFFETLASPKAAAAIARDLGLRTAVLDPLEGLQQPGGQEYFGIMRGNLRALRTALSCA